MWRKLSDNMRNHKIKKPKKNILIDKKQTKTKLGTR